MRNPCIFNGNGFPGQYQTNSDVLGSEADSRSGSNPAVWWWRGDCRNRRNSRHESVPVGRIAGIDGIAGIAGVAGVDGVVIVLMDAAQDIVNAF